MFRLEDYDYELPRELIAQHPVHPRDESRLLVLWRESGKIQHRRFKDLPELLPGDTLLVANNSKVIKARLAGRRIRKDRLGNTLGGKVEFFLLEKKAPRIWEGMFHASVKHRPGVEFEIPVLRTGEVVRGRLIRGASDSHSGTVVAEFDRDPVEAGAGSVPLPPYIQRNPAAQLSSDAQTYQTVYAEKEGSSAAPTAGLHFSENMIEALKAKGCAWRMLTLHVGLGTFRPVKTPDIRKHLMHEEFYEIPETLAEDLTRAKTGGAKILAVGTTSLRALESSWDAAAGRMRSGSARTSLFLYPGHGSINVVDKLLTNFHLPRSTLLMLVSAFAGVEPVRKAYAEAIHERYRFFSYGDAMLIL